MKCNGIINSCLIWLLARMGHGDKIVVADCGLPIPRGIPRVDLALIKGVPTFQQVIQALKEEAVFQRLVVAQEMRTYNPAQFTFLKAMFPDLPIEEIPHEMFKKMLHDVVAVVRTGEATPYSNVILEAGVSF